MLRFIVFIASYVVLVIFVYNEKALLFVCRYQKPAHRPQPTQALDNSFMSSNISVVSADAVRRDLLWKASRISEAENIQRVPSWTGFNSFVTQTTQPVAMIRYLPFIRAPPTDLSTIYTILLKLVQLADTLGQSHILITADMAIYSKAQEILWAKPPALEGKVTMRVGGMHLTMAFLASLGFLYGDGGLLSLLTDSEVYANETARKMLQGKAYSRGVRGMKIVYEALFRLFFLSMTSWLNRQGRSLQTAQLNQKISELGEAIRSKDTVLAVSLTEEIESGHLTDLKDVIEEYRQFGRATSKTFAYWDTFLQGVDLLLGTLRAERDANFDLHLSVTCELMPWLWAAGRHTYAKFIPTYIADMKAMEVAQPESYLHMQNGGFVVRRAAHHGFNCVATDQALEQTVNRDGKSKGGLIGLTLRKGALSRWLITRHITAEYKVAFKALCTVGTKTNKAHEELGKARITRDERDVCRIMDAAQQYQNPFDLNTVPSELINISTGHVASAEVSRSLGTFLEGGQKKHQDFVNQRLVDGTKSKSFWDPESRSKVVTFANMRKPMTNLTKDKMFVDSEVLFRRMLVVSKVRDTSLETLLEHELATVPPSMFHDDGMMRKTTKADLTAKLESTCDEVQDLTTSCPTAYVIDGMGLLQTLNESLFTTFDDLGDQILKTIRLLLAKNLGILSITIVFDRYDQEQSVKQNERLRRGLETGATYIIKGSRTVPNYRKFLQNPDNKAALAAFVSDYVLSTGTAVLDEEQCIVLAGGFKNASSVKMTTRAGVSNLPNLFSSHEEADTRMLLHAVHLSSTCERITVRCDDTDVLVLLLYYVSMGMLGTSVYMYTGHNTTTRDRRRYIPVCSIADRVGKDLCQNLPAAHALTGCDTTNSFFKIGKRIAYSKLIEHVKARPDIFKKFGLSDDIEEDITVARVYVVDMYSSKKTRQCSNLDKLRYILASTTDKPAAKLPPTEDAFIQHVKRARYQVAIWCQSHVAMPRLWNPNGNGWKLCANGSLEPVMFTKDVAPAHVRDLTHLYCTDKECQDARKCQCLQAGLTCTEFCSCRADGCKNCVTEDDSDSDHEDESDE